MILKSSDLLVQERAVPRVALPAGVLQHVHALEVVADGEEEGEVVPAHHVHGGGADQGLYGPVGLQEREEDPAEGEQDGGGGLEDAVGPKEGGHGGVVAAEDHVHCK